MMNAHPFSFYIYTYIFRFTPSQCTGALQWHVLNSPSQFYLFPVLCVVYYTTFYKKLCKLRINISELVLYLYRPHPCIYSMYNSCCKNIVYVKTVNELNFYTSHFTPALKVGCQKHTHLSSRCTTRTEGQLIPIPSTYGSYPSRQGKYGSGTLGELGCSLSKGFV